MHEILILNRSTANGKCRQKKSTHLNTKFSVLNLYIRLEYLNEYVIGPERKHSRHTHVGLFLSIYLNSISSHLIVYNCSFHEDYDKPKSCDFKFERLLIFRMSCVIIHHIDQF